MIDSWRETCKYNGAGFALYNRDSKEIDNREDKVTYVEDKDHIKAVSFFFDSEEAEKESNKGGNDDDIDSVSNIGEVDFVGVII